MNKRQASSADDLLEEREMGFRFQQPDNETDFELFCLRFLRHEWRCPHLQRLGKRGEAQFGIDLIDQSGAKPLRAAQCKHHESDKTIPFAEVEAEVELAKTYLVALDEYYVLSTARKTVDLQNKLLSLNQRHREDGLFIVTVLTWQDIDERLCELGEDIRDHILHGDTGRGLSDLRRMIKDELSEAPGRSLNDNEHLERELDYAKQLIGNNEHGLARNTLERIEKESWDKLTDRQRYRTLALQASTYISGGSFEQAGKLLLRAVSYQRDDEKAQVNESLGHELLGETAQAHDLAKKLRERYPHSSSALAVWLRTASADIPVSELLKGVPEYLTKEGEVAAAVASLALGRNEIVTAVEYGRSSTKSSPTWPAGWMALAQSLHLAGWNATSQSEREATLREAERAYTQAVELARTQHVAYIEAQSLLNRGILRDILGDVNAEKDFEAACRLSTADEPTAFRYGLFLAEHGRLDEAVDWARRAHASGKINDSGPFLASVLYDRNKPGDRSEAYEISRDVLEGKTSGRTSAALEIVLGFLTDNGETEEAIRFLDSLPTSALPAVVRETFRARVLNAKGERELAIKSADCAMDLLTLDTAREDRWCLAITLTKLGLDNKAVDVFQSVVRPGRFDLATKQLLDSAYKAGRHDVLLRKLRELREAGVRDRRVLADEIALLQRYDPEKAIAILQETIRAEPGNKDARLWLSLFGVQLRRPELICHDPELLPAVDGASPATTGRWAVGVLRYAGKHEAALRYAYELLRRNYRDKEAHLVYLYLFLLQPFRRNPPLEFLAPPQSIGPGAAVAFAEAGSSQIRWVVIEDTPDVHEECGELNSVHPVAAALSGKRVGETVILADSSIQPRTAVIKEVLSKYVYRFQECSANFQLRFPNEPDFQMVHVGSNDNGASSYDFTAITRSLEKRKTYVAQLLDQYKLNGAPLNMLAEYAGRDLFEILDHLVATPRNRVRCCAGSLDERQAAFESLSEGRRLVIDATALYSVGLLEHASILGTWSDAPIISLATRALIIDLLDEARHNPRDGVLVVDQTGELGLRETTAEGRQRYEEKLEQLLSVIDQVCHVLPCPQLAELAAEKREQLIECFGQHGAESLLLANEPKRVLWTDDQMLAAFAHGEFNVKRVWTQVALHAAAEAGTLDWQAFNNDSAVLHAAGYSFTWWTPEVFESTAKRVGWNSSSFLLGSLLDDLGSPTVMRDARFLLAAAAIRSCYHAAIDPVARNGFVVTIMERLARVEAASDCVATVLLVLTKLCVSDPDISKDVRWTLHAWLLAR